MKIAIGALSPSELNPGHFGESPGFVVVETDDHGVPVRQDWRENPWATEPIETRPPKIAALIEDCDAILVRAIAKEGLAQLSQRFTVMLSHEMHVPTVLVHMEAGGTSIFRRYDRDLGKFVDGV